MKERVTLEPVPYAKKPVLRQLLELYSYDFTEYLGMDISEQGYYGYPFLDHYWTEQDRTPYFIRVEGRLAGFVLVHRKCMVCQHPEAHSIAEFFVLKKYRRQGVGTLAAQQVIGKHPGWWEVLWLVENKEAGRFWRTTLAPYRTYESAGYLAIHEKDKRGIIFTNKGSRQSLDS